MLLFLTKFENELRLNYMFKMLDGKKLAEKLLNSLEKEINKNRLKLRLAVVLVGGNDISKIYIKKKKEACNKIGIGFELHHFKANISQSQLKKKITELVKDKNNSGIVIQLPLPKNFDTQEILNLIPPEKDPDCLSNKKLSVLPPVVSAVSKFFKEYKIKIKGKNAVVVGRGKLVGGPVASWLEKEKVRVFVIDKFTKNPSFFTEKADIIISGAGSPGLIRGDMVKKGVVIIDAGTSSEAGGLKGDVDFESVAKKASYITPLPGGIGPMTIVCLIENLVILNKK